MKFLAAILISLALFSPAFAQTECKDVEAVIAVNEVEAEKMGAKVIVHRGDEARKISDRLTSSPNPQLTAIIVYIVEDSALIAGFFNDCFVGWLSTTRDAYEAAVNG